MKYSYEIEQFNNSGDCVIRVRNHPVFEDTDVYINKYQCSISDTISNIENDNCFLERKHKTVKVIK